MTKTKRVRTGSKVKPDFQSKKQKSPEAVKRGRANRRRGHQFQREVAELFRRWFPKARRGLQDRDGEEFCDVEGTPYWIECKRRKKYLTVKALWEEIVSDGRPVLMIWKLDRQPIQVTGLDFVVFNGQRIPQTYPMHDVIEEFDEKYGASSRPQKGE